jgi:uncharacterized membrane protein YphA (DoxX/SURF4 family)
MNAEETSVLPSRRVLGLGVMALGVVGLAWGDFDLGQPVSPSLPGRTALAYVAGVFMLVAGAAIEWRRTAARGAAALAAYFGIVVFVLMSGRVALAHYTEFGAYSGAAEQLAIAAGALIVYADSAGIGEARTARLTRISTLAFGVCAVLFGGAHFFYMELTAPLVPQWLPPSQVFWGYATGIAQIAAGVAILTGVQARLAAVLLTVMYVSFGVLVHAPLLVADPSSRVNWSENATNLALVGVAWVVAGALDRSKRAGR